MKPVGYWCTKKTYNTACKFVQWTFPKRYDDPTKEIALLVSAY